MHAVEYEKHTPIDEIPHGPLQADRTPDDAGSGNQRQVLLVGKPQNTMGLLCAHGRMECCNQGKFSRASEVINCTDFIDRSAENVAILIYLKARYDPKTQFLLISACRARFLIPRSIHRTHLFNFEINISKIA